MRACQFCGNLPMLLRNGNSKYGPVTFLYTCAQTIDVCEKSGQATQVCASEPEARKAWEKMNPNGAGFWARLLARFGVRIEIVGRDEHEP